MKMGFEITIEHGDALDFKADVLMLKYAKSFYGLDAIVQKKLRAERGKVYEPEPDTYALVPSPPNMPYQWILIVGTGSLHQLKYPALRDLGRNMLEALYRESVDVHSAATTFHNVNSGVPIDEVEAFRSILLGFADAVGAATVPPSLKRITFVEQDEHRANLMREALEKFLPPGTARALSTMTQSHSSFDDTFIKPLATEETPHVFVAMPFADDFDDQYYLAIRPAITEHKILCIRLDQAESAFTGDIMEQVKERIRTAKLVVAVLDGNNPNVYLEVGYAWGVGTPTVLILHENETPPFDVQGARLIKYNKIYRLKEQIAQELKLLL